MYVAPVPGPPETLDMRYVVRVVDPSDDSVHLYRFSDETEADQFAGVMRRLGGNVEITGEEEPAD